MLKRVFKCFKIYMNKSNGRRNTKSKQKRQHTNSGLPAIVVKDASVPARAEKLSVRAHYSASTRMGDNQRQHVPTAY